MIEAFYGAEYLALGVLMDQLGTYLVLSTLGILVAAMFSPQITAQFWAAAVLRKGASFAPFQALVLALALRHVEFSPSFENLRGA